MFRRIRDYYKLQKVKKSFRKHSASDVGTSFLIGATCKNTGDASNVVIEPHCTIGAIFMCQCGGRIQVGKDTYIGPGTCIQAKESITIGSSVIVANNALLCDNNNHPTDPKLRLEMSACDDFMHDELWTWKYSESAPIIIEDNVWIGRDARILKGVTVGKGSIVAMGAIVTHDVPPYCIVAGNPAKIVKQLSHEE